MKKLLINKKTNTIFPYHPLLAKNKDIVPYNEEVHGKLDAEEQKPSGATSENGSIIISRARKEELITFAFQNYGIQIEDDLTVAEIREQVKRLVEAG